MTIDTRKLYRRKIIALIVTGGVAAILISVMVIEYTGGTVAQTANTAGVRLGAFYTTIVSEGQSFFASK